MENIKKGIVVNGRYRLEEFKGGGTFGDVWLAKDLVTSKDIAIKIYVALNQQGCKEFMDEFKIAAGIQHPNLLVTDKYDVWQNSPYLIMKYCSRGSAASLVGNLSPNIKDEMTIWRFIRDVSAGLECLHNLEPYPIVHQDIKPDNILIDDDGTFMITDFGISKKIRSTMSKQSSRALSSGSTSYMGPERFSKNPDPILASDIWSLGVSIYELAEGRLPFSGMGGIMLKNGAEMPDLSTGWTKDLTDIMHFCLEKETWDRGQAHQLKEIADKVLKSNLTANVAKLIDEIRKRENPDPPKPPKPPTPPQPPKPKPKRNKVFIGIALAAIAVIVTAYILDAPRREARSHISEYSNLVSVCDNGISSGSSSNTKDLLSAKDAYKKIVSLERAYSNVLPETFYKSESLKDNLNEKLAKAAQEWADVAKSQAHDLSDYSNAISYYQLALKLWDAESIDSEFNQILEECAWMKINDIEFYGQKGGERINEESYEVKDGVKIVYTNKIPNLGAKIRYNGFKSQDAVLNIKIISPDGYLHRGRKSPSGYTFMDSITVQRGLNSLNLSGWGTGEVGHYERGLWTYEIWYKGKCIYKTNFTVK